jgi:hypothetical protein
VSDDADFGIGREATTESFEHRLGKVERDSFCAERIQLHADRAGIPDIDRYRSDPRMAERLAASMTT